MIRYLEVIHSVAGLGIAPGAHGAPTPDGTMPGPDLTGKRKHKDPISSHLPQPQNLYTLAQGPSATGAAGEEEDSTKMTDAADEDIMREKSAEAVRQHAIDCRSQTMQRLLPRPSAAPVAGI